MNIVSCTGGKQKAGGSNGQTTGRSGKPKGSNLNVSFQVNGLHFCSLNKLLPLSLSCPSHKTALRHNDRENFILKSFVFAFKRQTGEWDKNGRRKNEFAVIFLMEFSLTQKDRKHKRLFSRHSSSFNTFSLLHEALFVQGLLNLIYSGAA